MINLTLADISDSTGAQQILDAIRKRWPWLKHLFADGAHNWGKPMERAAFLDFTVEIIRRITAEPGFKVLPRRWVVVDVSREMIDLATASLLLRRIHQYRFQMRSKYKRIVTAAPASCVLQDHAGAR